MYASLIWCTAVIESHRHGREIPEAVSKASLFPRERVLSARVLLGWLSCHSLRTKRNVYLGKHFIKLVRGGVDNAPTLTEIGFWVLKRKRSSRSHPLFIPVGARNRALSDAALTKTQRKSISSTTL
jgi:hypothetical protein